ncbi:MAG: nuclease [Chloroflexi bacterium]|nr:nuclease [Chloroflexota bacterium]MDL1942356.1 nuclease [Chloroflexi bacterium CFX2]
MKFINDIKIAWQRSGINKILMLSLVFLVCLLPTACCSLLALSPSSAVPTQDVNLIYTHAYLTAEAGIFLSYTSTANALPTSTEIPTSTFTAEPTITLSPEPTSVTKNIEGADCIPLNEVEVAKVVEVVDGDTIKVYFDEKVFSVRYIGIDTPEISGQFYSSEAKAKNSELVLQKEVMLIKDISETDQYGRLLRYIIVDNTFVNYELVEKGYAKAIAYPPDIACEESLRMAESSAKNSSIGIWQPPTPAPVLNTPAGSGSTGSNCHPSYPGVCIPPPPPDLDCPDIPYRQFQVLPPDPHRFDRDGDGIGCEG